MYQQLIQNIVGPELLVSHTPLNNLFHGGGLTKQPRGITLMTLHDAKKLLLKLLLGFCLQINMVGDVSLIDELKYMMLAECIYWNIFLLTYHRNVL